MAYLRGFEALQKKESCKSNHDMDVVKCQKYCHLTEYCRYYCVKEICIKILYSHLIQC